MINQTIFVDNLRKRMHVSFENKFYLESIACSYAIIENRTKRICEHIGKSVNGDMLNKKTEYIYNAIKNKDLESDVKKKKMIGFLQYRIKNTKLLNIDFSKDYKAFNLTVDNTTLDNQLITFRKLRNDFTHDMYRYDSTNPKLINFEDYVDLAKMGIYVAENLCSISSAMKRKKMKLQSAEYFIFQVNEKNGIIY